MMASLIIGISTQLEMNPGSSLAAIEELLLDFHEGDVEAGGSGGVSDAVSHGPAADHSDLSHTP